MSTHKLTVEPLSWLSPKFACEIMLPHLHDPALLKEAQAAEALTDTPHGPNHVQEANMETHMPATKRQDVSLA